MCVCRKEEINRNEQLSRLTTFSHCAARKQFANNSANQHRRYLPACLLSINPLPANCPTCPPVRPLVHSSSLTWPVISEHLAGRRSEDWQLRAESHFHIRALCVWLRLTQPRLAIVCRAIDRSWLPGYLDNRLDAFGLRLWQPSWRIKMREIHSNLNEMKPHAKKAALAHDKCKPFLHLQLVSNGSG